MFFTTKAQCALLTLPLTWVSAMIPPRPMIVERVVTNSSSDYTSTGSKTSIESSSTSSHITSTPSKSSSTGIPNRTDVTRSETCSIPTSVVSQTYCRVSVGTVQVHFWPTGTATKNMTYPSTRVYPEYNMTMTSPSIYYVINTMIATDYCGNTIGPTFKNYVTSYNLNQVSTLQPFASIGATTRIGPPEQLQLSDLNTNCPTVTAIPTMNHNVYNKNNPGCDPVLEFNADLIHIDDADEIWKDCGRTWGGKLGIFDPPIPVAPCTGGDCGDVGADKITTATAPLQTTAPPTLANNPATSTPSPAVPSPTTSAGPLVTSAISPVSTSAAAPASSAPSEAASNPQASTPVPNPLTTTLSEVSSNPQASTPAPNPLTAAPSEASSNPQAPTPVSSPLTTAPSEASSNPQAPTPVPSPLTTAPSEAASNPQASTPVPNPLTTTPSEASSNPQAPTPVPSPLTTAPSEASSNPQAPTPVPSPLTTAPSEASSNPQAPTPVPSPLTTAPSEAASNPQASTPASNPVTSAPVTSAPNAINTVSSNPGNSGTLANSASPTNPADQSSASQVVIGTPIVVATLPGSNTVSVLPGASSIIIGSQTLLVGEAVTVSGAGVVSLAPSGGRLVVSNQEEGGVPITYAIPTNTALPSQNAAVTVPAVGIVTVAPGAMSIVIGSQTAALGGAVITISGQAISLSPSGLVVSNEAGIVSTYNLPSATPAEKIVLTLPVGVVTATASASSILIGSQTASVGGPAVTIEGQGVVSLSPSALVFSNVAGVVSTYALESAASFSGPGASIPTAVNTINGQIVSVFPVGSSIAVVGGHTLTIGGAVATLSGNQVASLGASGVIVQIPSGRITTLAIPKTSVSAIISKAGSVTASTTMRASFNVLGVNQSSTAPVVTASSTPLGKIIYGIANSSGSRATARWLAGLCLGVVYFL